MYRGKPLIVASRPFWRHPYWAWGWYSLTQDALHDEWLDADGYFKPGDGGGGGFRWHPACTTEPNGGTVIKPGIVKQWSDHG